MTTPKTMLCRCEDITLDECSKAIGDGFNCFEDLKRFLGVGTGPCQGKSCVQAAMHLVAEARGIPVSKVDVMTFRPPVRPIAFATLAAPDAAGVAAEARTGVTGHDVAPPSAGEDRADDQTASDQATERASHPLEEGP